MKLCISKKNIYLFIGFFLLMLLSFNISLNTSLWGINAIYGCILISVICILLCQNAFGNITSMTVNKSSAVIWGMPFLPILFNNFDLARGKIVYLLYYLVVILWGYFLCQMHGWSGKTWGIIRFFCLFHFGAGLFLLTNENFLLNNIVPLFPLNESAEKLLLDAINSGYMTGLCYHYSTTGMYMSIGVIAFSGVLFRKRNTKWREVFMLIAFIIGLAMTGKRGPLIFTILSLVISSLSVREKRMTRKQLRRGALTIIIFLLTFMVSYAKVPQLKQVIDRFMVGSDSLNDFSSGRIEYFWVNALSLFTDSPIWGHGWRSFKYIGAGTLNANDAHNIYFQLLAEVGLVGFGLVMFFMCRTLIVTYKAIKMNEVEMNLSDTEASILKMAFTYQIFFLLYGFTGNPLYDPQCYFPYFICCAIGYSAMNRICNRGVM